MIEHLRSFDLQTLVRHGWFSRFRPGPPFASRDSRGDLTLLRATDAVDKEATQCEADERTGLLILKQALEAPTREIAANSSADAGVMVSQMRAGQGSYGFDAPPESMWTCWNWASSTRPKSSAWPSKMRSPWPECCS